mgnify:CR=1 FL=1
MEMFKVIEEYPDYCVSTEGKVVNNKTGKFVKASRKPNGYMQLNLVTGDGRRKKEYVHRLVAITFLPNPEKLPQVNHIDRNRSNNVLPNLEWVTSKENVAKSAWPKRVRVRRVTGEVVGDFGSIQEACLILGLTGSNVSCCLHTTRQKTHKGYVFEFL